FLGRWLEKARISHRIRFTVKPWEAELPGQVRSQSPSLGTRVISNWKRRLRRRALDLGQGQIVAVAAFIIDLEGVATGGEDETVRKIFELAVNGSRRSVIDDDNHSAVRKNAAVIVEQGELRLGVDLNSIGDDLRESCFPEAAIKEAVRIEGDRTEDGESAGLTEAFARDEKGPIPWNIGSDRNRAGNDPRATERTRLHEYRTAARARSGRVIDQQRAIANVRATGVVISIGQVQATLGILLERSTAADNSSK